MDLRLVGILVVGLAGFVILFAGFLARRAGYPSLAMILVGVGLGLIAGAAGWSYFWYYGFLQPSRYGSVPK